MKHLVESQQFDRDTLETLFRFADALETKREQCMEGKVMACLFYEPSTRTRLSFESAMVRLGGGVISTENARDFSSAAKGETIEDTIRVIGNYADIIVLRHHEAGSAERAARVSAVPIINAGDGVGQHPTQALLDLYTIRRELGGADGIRIAMVGDLKNGRTVRSLAYLLTKYKNVEVVFVSPRELSIGEDIKEYLRKRTVRYQETEDLDATLGVVDVVYQTRIQKERFPDPREYEKFKGRYVIDGAALDRMRPTAIVMHPLPRVDEIAIEVDSSERAAYFRQAYYGLLTRMAILKLIAEEV